MGKEEEMRGRNIRKNGGNMSNHFFFSNEWITILLDHNSQLTDERLGL